MPRKNWKRIGKKNPTTLLQVRMQSNQLLPKSFSPPLTDFCPAMSHNHSHDHCMWDHDCITLTKLSQVWGHLAISKCPQSWLTSVKVKQSRSHMEKPPGFLVLYFTQNTFVVWACLQHCCGVQNNLQKNHWLCSLACTKGLNHSLCHWTNPISWHKSQWTWKKQRKTKDVSMMFLHVQV